MKTPILAPRARAGEIEIPLVDLIAQYNSIAGEIHAAMAKVLERGDYILGEEVCLFEEEFARYCGVRYAVGLDSGISALELALRAYGIGPGDEVITAANTFIATASAISFVGARPVLVDMHPQTYNLDVSLLEKAVTPHTRAVIPVHLYGQMADMDAILEVARRHRLIVIEDAAQAHGATYKGRRAGSLGDVGCFSFYPAKNLGAYGDAGMLVTNDARIAEKVRMLRNYGQKEKYVHEFLAYNRRLDTLQAAMLRVKLRHLDEWNARRRAIAQTYDERLAGLGIQLPAVADCGTHVYHLYVIRIKRRDELQRWLASHGIATGIHYPIPIHLQSAYADLGYSPGDFPETERHCQEILSLPMYPELTSQQLAHIYDAITAFVSGNAMVST